jgi:HD-GYP domain-containing protein (c-di-GMP phosphodiesterase class II)
MGCFRRPDGIAPGAGDASAESSGLKGFAPRSDTEDVSPAPARIAPPEVVPLTDVLASLSFALDLTEGQPMGHSLRACLISLELAERLDLPLQVRRDLYFAAILKDAGCSSNAAAVFEMFGGDEIAAKRARMRTDWSNDLRAAMFALEHASPGDSWFERAKRVASLARLGPRSAVRLVQLRCDRGAEVVLELGFGRGAAEAVRALDEHWDGHGQPKGLRGEQIPIAARVLGLAQILEVFAAGNGPTAGLSLVRRRSGKWFDPTVAEACRGLEPLLERWAARSTHDLRAEVSASEPGHAALLAGRPTLHRLGRVFADIVDAKSPYTGAHSQRVAELAVGMARTLGWERERVEETRSAALLHDLGKLSVPNRILDKPGALDPHEWEIMRMHALYTERILEHVQGYEWFAFASAAHHERMDGSGYCRGIGESQLPELSRVLAVADVYDALSAPRPYRHALEPPEAFAIMERDGGKGFCEECLEALRCAVGDGDSGEDEAREAA